MSSSMAKPTVKHTEVIIHDSDGNVLYYGRQRSDRKITIPVKKILEFKKRWKKDEGI